MDESIQKQDTAQGLWPHQSGTSQSICGCGYICAAAAIPLKGLWPKGRSALDKVPLEASVAVHKVMLEHLKVCGCR